ncbi:MAG: hypothetical protein AAF502_07260 [Bacteroidota bacterium]
MKYLTIILIPLLLLSACDDDDGTFSLAPLIEHRGIYINDFLTAGILGDVTKEDQLLEWIDINDFNNIYLYNIGAILSGSSKSALDAFVQKAHSYEDGIDVTFVSAGFGTSFDNIESYHDHFHNLPKGIVSEIEFWNGGMDYVTDYLPWINRLNSLKYDVPPGTISPRNPDVIRRFYIGKIKNSGEVPSLEIAKELVTHHDEILLTNYHTDAFDLSDSEEENSIKNKLRLLALAGMELNKPVNIVILFNVRQDSPSPHIKGYFDVSDGNNEFEQAYVSFHGDFEDATDIPHKSFLNLKGFGIYRYTDAKDARP